MTTGSREARRPKGVKKFMPVGAGSGFRSAAYGGAFRATGVPCLSFAGERAEKKGARNHWREWP